MNPAIKSAFEAAKTGGDIVRLCENLHVNDLAVLKQTLESMDRYFGLTLRDEYILTIISLELKQKTV